MIAFDLACDCGYQFEGWFKNHEALTSQMEKGLLLCPQCNGVNLKKLLSPVAFHSSPAPADTPLAKIDCQDTIDNVAGKFLHALQGYVDKNFEDVGAKLSGEALKMHYGLEESRNIRGIATAAEEEMLKKEGVELLKIPLPNKANSQH